MSLGNSAFELYMERNPIDPLIVKWEIEDQDLNRKDYDQMWEEAIQNMQRAMINRKRVMEQRRDRVDFKEGLEVLVKTLIKSSLKDRVNKSLSAKFIGSKELIRFFTPNIVLLCDYETQKKYTSYVSLIIPYFD